MMVKMSRFAWGLRVSFSIFFGGIISLPWYYWFLGMQDQPLLSWEHLRIFFLLIVPTCATGYFFLYRADRLEKFLNQRDSGTGIFFLNLFNVCCVGTSFWFVYWGCFAGWREPYGTVWWMFMTIIGFCVSVFIGGC